MSKEPSDTIVQIQSLGDLLICLNNGDFDSVTNQLVDVRFDEGDFSPFAVWNEDRYTRNCIARTDAYELVLLCWQPGQETAIHCHDEKECWVKVLQGSFEEKTYFCEENKVEATGCRTLAPFEVTSATESTFLHSLKNTSTEQALTLHLYMKPIDKCRVYSLETKAMNLVQMVYDTINGKPA